MEWSAQAVDLPAGDTSDCAVPETAAVAPSEVPESNTPGTASGLTRSTQRVRVAFDVIHWNRTFPSPKAGDKGLDTLWIFVIDLPHLAYGELHSAMRLFAWGLAVGGRDDQPILP